MNRAEQLIAAVEQSQFPYLNSLIHLFVGGSELHGAKVKNTDDLDIYGVYLEPPELVLELDKQDFYVWSTAGNERRNGPDDIDVCLYSLRKWAGLGAKGNPTALHFLFSRSYAPKAEPWDQILKNRDVFLSRQAALQFRGFAEAQVRRLQGIGTGKKGQRHELIGVHWYDIKAAMHVIRLLNEGIELMRSGTITLPRPEKELLITIRTGNYGSLERVLSLANTLFSELKDQCNSKFFFPEICTTRRIMSRMPHGNLRKVFLVVAGGNIAAERHFEDTIQRTRTVEEVRGFLPPQEVENLERIYHGSNFIAWGAVPGPMNESRWEKMTAGDVVLIYNSGRIRFAGEIAAKVRNKDLARYFWKENEAGSTWELMYFIVNEEKTNVPIEKLNPLFGYQAHYRPQGFSMVNEEAVSNFAQNYGDILGVLKTLERGEELIHLPMRKDALNAHIDEHIERVTTEHDEMQWRLIRLGQRARYDVWVPRSDQTKQYEGHQFRDFVLHEFHHTVDVPRSVENIDVVWKFGLYSIKSAFEIEHSTSVYSGILRLSDLRAEAPNSNYPLFIVASENRRRKVFDELRRPTFSGPCLRLHEVIKFLGYEKIREIDESSKNARDFDTNAFMAAGENVPLV